MADLDPDVVEHEIVPRLEAPTEGRVTPTPYSYRFTGEDALRVRSWGSSSSSASLGIHGRILRFDGTIRPFAFSVPVSNDRISRTSELELGEGYLLNASAFSNVGEPFFGETFASVQVIRGRGAAAFVLGTLMQGHVNALQHLSWPGSPIIGSIETRGVMRQITGTNPAAGNAPVEVVPDGARWHLASLSLTFVTNATVANRRPVLLIFDSGGGSILYSAPLNASLVASTTYVVSWGVGQAFVLDTGFNHASAPLPEIPWLVSGQQIVISTSGMQAGDDWADPFLLVQEWLEGQT